MTFAPLESAPAIERREDGALLGVISLTGLHPVHRRAELGYWVGVPYWGKGYATEAARLIIGLGFREGLNSIFARFFTQNPASGRVMQKAGMRYEGTLRQHVCKNGEFLDLAYYSILRSEWQGQASPGYTPMSVRHYPHPVGGVMVVMHQSTRRATA